MKAESNYKTKSIPGVQKSTEGIFKDVTVGGIIPIERKNRDPENAHAIARCVFAGNHLPDFRDRSGGVWDRMRIIPFEKIIRGSVEDNPSLKYELIEELPGILNWAICSLSGLLD